MPQEPSARAYPYDARADGGRCATLCANSARPSAAASVIMWPASDSSANDPAIQPPAASTSANPPVRTSASASARRTCADDDSAVAAWP
jgi:hypothetical protein